MPLMTPEERGALSICDVEIGKVRVNSQKSRDLLDITVENSVQLPDMVTIRIQDRDFKWIDSDEIKIGTDIVVRFGYEKSKVLKVVFAGEVTAIEADLTGQRTATLVVRGYDAGHRLQMGRKTWTYLKQKDSEIAKKLAQEAGIDVGTVDNSEETHEYVIQNNQTNWDFLQERARRIGFECFVGRDRKFYFRKRVTEEVGKLTWGEELLSFRPRATGARQVGGVQVRGWDPGAKKEIVGKSKQAEHLPKIGFTNNGDGGTGGVIAGALKAAMAEMIVVDRPVHTQGMAQAMAQAVLNELSQDAVTADAVALGNPEVRAGTWAEVGDIGKRFSGKYYVTSATHTWSPDENYMTTFVTGGQHPQTISALLAPSGGGGGAGDRSGTSTLNAAGGNIVVGLVTDNKDPQNLGRVKVRFPWLVEDHESTWARVVSPMGGVERGLLWLPEIEDEVLVAFEHGDMTRPYVLGGLWNGVDKPPMSNDDCVKDGKVVRRVIRSRYGHQILLDDTKDEERIDVSTKYGHHFQMDDKPGRKLILLQTNEKHVFRLVDDNKKFIEALTKYGHQIKMDDDDKYIFVTTKSGHQIKLDDNGNKITIKTQAGHQIEMDDPGGKIEIKDKAGGQKMTFDSNGQGVKTEATMTIDIKAMNITINGQGSVTVKSPSISLGP